MDVFKKYKNILFRIMVQILNKSIGNCENLSKEQLRGAFESNGYYDPTDAAIRQFIDNLMTESECEALAFGLLNHENERYEASLPGRIPCRPSTDELEWLKSMLSDYRVAIFLSFGTIQKMLEALCDVAPFYTEDDVRYNRNISEQDYTDPIFADHFKILVESIVSSRMIKLESKSRNGVCHHSDVFPLCIDYNCVNDMFQLIVYHPEERRKIAVNIDLIMSVEQIETIFDGVVDKNAEMETVTIEITKRKNSYTQCFQIFSDYIKRVEYEKKTELYRIEVDYYKFEESDVFKNLISLGQACKIVSPSRLVEQAKTRIFRAKSLWKEIEEY
jgi:hypothetical protein